ncbi:oligosaccharyl transferase, archaeosortase A system-associated [Halobacteriales archaeon QS_4_62_28]|nr:MAG: oligosaccharyl transferase, archaeosortase A system-associated [Halobacteriales archaeon QS_4_62_28]
MSQWRGRLEENAELERAVDWVQRYYHLVLGVLLLGFMLWNRVRPWENFVVDGEVLFSGNDAWYHYRSTAYTVRNWPQTMAFDPWTYFSNGTDVGQFGTLLDQLMATVALIVGLGSPSDQTVKLVVLFAPAVIAVLAGFPTYYIGRRLSGRIGGIVALTVLALSAGSVVQRSMVGFSDHHIAEVLFQALGVLGTMVAVSVTRRDRPVYEQFVDRDIDGLRDTIVWSVLAGFAISLYLWVWPFGILLVGILGVYLLLQMNIEFMRGESPEHTAIAGAIALGVTSLLMFVPITTAEFTVGTFSLLHPTVAALVALGCVFLAWLAREWEARDIDAVFYPLSVLSIIVVGAIAARVLTPGVFDLFANNIVRVFGGVIGIDPSAQAGTIAEVSQLRQPVRVLFQAHGFAVFLALIGALVIVFRNLIGSKVPPERLLVVVWTAFVVAAALTQGRFAYYLAIPFGVLTAYVVGHALSWANTETDDSTIETYQVLTVVAILFLVVAPMAAVASPTDISRYDSPGQGIEGWTDGLEYLQDQTPKEGTYGGETNDMEYYGSYENTDDFDYQPGQYGVLSWWDYGHWITTQGERIPNANPFQQGATNAANFLLAPNETQANDVLDEIDENDTHTRYIAIDWKMAESNGQIGGKYFAPTEFYDESNVNRQDYYGPISYQLGRGGQTLSFNYHTQKYYESTVIRLYKFHGSAVEPQPIVTDWNLSTTQNGRQIRVSQGGQAIQTFQSMEKARAYARNDTTSVVGGIGSAPAKRVPAMEHYRLVGTSEKSATDSGRYNRGAAFTALGAGLQFQQVNSTSECSSNVTIPLGGGSLGCVPEQTDQFLHPTSPQWVKMFERVPGATIEGNGPENATVRASVEMYNPASNETFTYTQQAQTDEDGNFNMTVPYSTTGYDEYGPDNGHTNVSVRANSSYQFAASSFDNGTITQWTGSTEVHEAAVIGDDDEPIQVELNSTEIDVQEQGNETNETSGINATDNSTTDDSDTSTATPSGTATATPGGTETATPSGTTTATPTATETATPTGN